MNRQGPFSCVLFHDVTEQANNMYATDSVNDLLGWTSEELRTKSFFSIVHPEEVAAAKNLHYHLIRNDSAATLTYLRLFHQRDNAYALCALSRSVAKNFVVGTISLASDDPGNTRAALATGGVFVLTPTAHHLSFRRYNTRGNLSDGEIYTGPPNGYPTPFSELPMPSDREALLLDRFTRDSAPVLHCSNNCIFTQELAPKEDLFNFIPDPKDKENLAKTMDLVKRWITTVEGPMAGPFTTCRFTVAPPGSAHRRVEGILIATSDAVLLTLVPLA